MQESDWNAGQSAIKVSYQGTANSILTKLYNFSFLEVINNIFVESKDKEMKELVKIFESQLLLAKTNPDKFKSSLHGYYKRTVNYIFKHHLERKFFEFYYFLTNYYFQKNANVTIVDAYFDLLLQLIAYLKPLRLIYGITTDEKLMDREEIFPNFDTPMFEYQEKYGFHNKKHIDELWSWYHGYGYNISSMDDIIFYTRYEQVTSNMILSMAYLIDENYEDMCADSCYYKKGNYFDCAPEWKSDEFYICEIDNNRKFLLPGKGIVGIYQNSGLIKQIKFKEKIFSNKIVLLFKIEVDEHQYIMGYYDPEYKSVETYFKNSNMPNIHKIIANFILENYYFLVCNPVIDVKRNSALKVVDNLEAENDIYERQPIVQYIEYNHDNTNDITASYQTGTHFDKSKYMIEIKHIQSFIRKLPAGYHASDEAIERAKAIGLKLAPNETFVRDFEKHIFRNN